MRIFADLKIMDAGARETVCASRAGGGIVSALGVAGGVRLEAA